MAVLLAAEPCDFKGAFQLFVELLKSLFCNGDLSSSRIHFSGRAIHLLLQQVEGHGPGVVRLQQGRLLVLQCGVPSPSLVPIPKDGTTNITAGIKIASGEAVYGGDRDYTLPAACAVNPTPSPTPTQTNTPTPSPSATLTLPNTGPSTPTASLSTRTVSPDGRVTVTASGLAANEPVEIWLHSTPVKLWSGVVNADGTLTQTVTIPTGIEIGKHQIEVRGTTSGSLLLDLAVTATLAATGFDPVAAGVGGGAGLLLLAGGIAALLLARRRGLLR
ncbi:hypothetical protein [Microbacterium hominis]|uniref:LPXTG cell wall anchor domain-containing protein n=1 Tax=Microbacterium hominis TaxID=162426 RepID=A0A0B4CZZ2_9MICO|nr:hypothetical protein [Microbacterium hominis]KIC59971.1 hypothetical protein RM52_00710 [Microbacterium hominis]